MDLNTQKQTNIITNNIFDNISNSNFKNGIVYTPYLIVNDMLNIINYKNNNILKKHIIDNSCGEGAFLIEIVDRYIKISKKNKLSIEEIILDLETFIHGIEINQFAYHSCLKKLDDVLIQNNIIGKVKWDIIQRDALTIKQFNDKMDYVVGNPPYIRIHNLALDYKQYFFTQKGMIDLYLIFFELSIKMLNSKGKLIYITPNSFFTSNAGQIFRNYLIKNQLLEKIINLGHFNPFKKITTYPAITLINKNYQKNSIRYYEYKQKYINPIKLIETLEYKDFYINKSFYFGNKIKIQNLKKILNTPTNPFISVKNAISTNLDNVFFNDYYEGMFINSGFKISSSKNTKVFYPYDKKGMLILLQQIEKKNPSIYQILLKNKEKLQNRSLQKNKWYEFARNQGINDVYKDKLVINNIVKNIDTIKIKELKSGIVPYGGYYILSKKYDFGFIKKIIINKDFIEYLKILKKNKNGNYYFFSTSDLHLYLSFKLTKPKDFNNGL